jgi:hypothetical protein
MLFIEAHRRQFLLAGSLAVAVTALTVTACGGGGGGGTAAAAAPTQGSAAGHWTTAEVSQFTAASGASGGNSQDMCAVGYFERDMSFGNAMDLVSVDPASGPSLSAAQVKAALVSKYGTTEGDAINAQFDQTATDSNSNCSGSAAAPSAAPSTAPVAAAPSTAPVAAPAATSESSCTVDCVNPVATGESGWLAQVQGALQNVQQDLNTVSSDASNNPDNLFLDGSQLTGDAQAALDPNYDPPPADNADWVTAMNDYVAAGEDYSNQNMNQQDDNPTQASAEITAGNTALASFNTANGGVLNGIIQSLSTVQGLPAAAPALSGAGAAAGWGYWPPVTLDIG